MTEPVGRWAGVDAWVRRHPIVPDLALAAALAALLLPASMSPVLTSSWPAPGRVALAGALVVAHACVGLRRAQPVLAFAVTSAVMLALLVPEVDGDAAGVAAAFPAILLPSSLVFPVVLYAVSAHCRARLASTALAVGLVGAALTAARLWQVTGLTVDPGGTARATTRGYVFAALVACVLAAWALGRFRHVRADHVASLSDRGAREERTRIAREVHDVVAHSLAVMVSQAEGARMVARTDPARAAPVFTTIAGTGREALTQMRALVGVLRENGAGSGDARSPQPGLPDLPALVEQVRAAGLAVELHESGHPGDLGGVGGLAAYRVVQESLTNVVKHAGSRARAEVALDWRPGVLVVEVVDDGAERVAAARGGTGAGRGQGPGHGLDGMRERVELVGGRLTAAPAGSGWRVEARIPRDGRRGT